MLKHNAATIKHIGITIYYAIQFSWKIAERKL